MDQPALVVPVAPATIKEEVSSPVKGRASRRKRTRAASEDKSDPASPSTSFAGTPPLSWTPGRDDRDFSGKAGCEDDERQIKRQKRLIKNRESAQLSRQRKKQYMEELERKVENLTNNNDVIMDELTSIRADKKKLEEEVTFLRNLIKHSPSMTAAEKKDALSPRNMKAAGVCLLIMLFSFGIVSQRLNVEPTSSSSSSSSLSTREEVPEVMPRYSPGRLLHSINLNEDDEDTSSISRNKRLIPELSMPKRPAAENNNFEAASDAVIFCPRAEQMRQQAGPVKQLSLVVPSNALNVTDAAFQSVASGSELVEIKCSLSRVAPYNTTKF